MAAKHVLDSVHEELPIGGFPKEILKYLLCCGHLEGFFLPPIRQQEKWQRNACEILIPMRKGQSREDTRAEKIIGSAF